MPYQLDRLLGQGGAARVYLARDESLGGREVALKVSADRGKSARSWGGSITPTSSPSSRSPSSRRRSSAALSCPSGRARPSMRSSGTSTPPWSRGPRRRSGRPWSKRPRTWPELEPTALSPRPTRRMGRLPDSGDVFDGAVAWVIAVLARALAHAHEQGILHRDVKPANVLMTCRDGPQLLDFNLSYDPHSADQAEAAMRRHAPLHGPRATRSVPRPGALGRCPRRCRPLFARPGDVRAADGPAPRHARPRLSPCPGPSAAARPPARLPDPAPPPQPVVPVRPGGDRRALPGLSPGGSLSRRPGPGRRPRAVPRAPALAHAFNPSVLERIGNRARRHRWAWGPPRSCLPR